VARIAIVQTGKMMPMIERQLAELFEVHKLHEAADPAKLLAEVGPRVEGVACGGHAIRTDESLLSKLPKARVVSSFGVGYDHVDTAAAKARGIVVTNTPDVLTEEVADTALGLLLMTVRELGKAEQYLRAGHWATKGDYRLTPLTLRERKVGIVGLGRIGKAIARRCEAFGMDVVYYGRSKQGDVPYNYYSDLAAMARDTGTLIVITPGGGGTKNLIDAKVLAALGPNGVVVNVSRGSVVDETALIAALKNKMIAAAGLDVFWNEPKIDPAFLELDNVVLTPHVGSGSVYTRDRMGQLVVDNLKAYAARKPPITPVPETPFKSW
jgi:lactate dehydrogenase-like 2-hydroxyacid dehydrogenase